MTGRRNPDPAGLNGRRIRQIIALAALVVGACSEPSNDPGQSVSNMAPAPVDMVSERVASDGLTPLTARDIALANLPGELACGFADRGQRALLYASGDVRSDEDAVGLLKIDGSVERVTVAGGFDALLRDPVLTGSQATVAVRIAEGASASGESPPRPASILLERAGQPDVRVDGTWTCGP